jgi:DNA polymerase III subunit epsilon
MKASLRTRLSSWQRPVYWSLDLETGGFDPDRHDVVSVGMVPIRDGRIRVGESFYSLIKPVRELSLESVKIRHLLPDELENAPSLSDVLPAIDARLREGVLLVHGGAIDLPFLRVAYAREGRSWPRPPVVDTMKLILKLSHHGARGPRQNRVPTTLWGARSHLGLPRHRNHHALSDAMATAELYLVLAHRLRARRLQSMLS